jgi:toxin ParE1/3/4
VARYTVIFDRDAEADLLSIRDHIARVRDPAFALEFVQRIVSYCERFSELPHRGMRRDEVRPDLRTVGWRRTVTIAFEVNEDTRQVGILGVFYRGRDVFAALQTRKRSEE